VHDFDRDIQAVVIGRVFDVAFAGFFVFADHEDGWQRLAFRLSSLERMGWAFRCYFLRLIGKPRYRPSK
jgi:hypothetical protein